MKTLLKVNLDTKTAKVGDEPWTPPVLTFRETLKLALRFEQTVDGQVIEPNFTITTMKAAIGWVDARPLAETWALQVGAGAQTADNTTAAVNADCTPVELAAAINAKSAIVAAFGTASVRKVDGSWLITFGAGAVNVPMQVRKNKLWPVSVGRIAAAAIDAVWVHDVRLIQTPVAFTDVGVRVLPDPPVIARLIAGGVSGDITFNEVQSLTIPADYRGTYALKLGFSRTVGLSIDDGPEEIQKALEGVLGANFKVTLAAAFTIHIEFIGKYKGTAMALLEVVLLSAPPGDLTFTLVLDKFELITWLRRLAEVTLPLTLTLVVNGGDLVAFQQEVTIRRPLIFPELALTPTINWLHPPSPKDYIPFSTESVLTGQQFFTAQVGNAVLTVFSVAHGLNTNFVHVWVRENISDGLQLDDGTHFTARITNANTVTITSLIGAPALNAWLVTVVSAQTVAAFAAGLTVTQAQVTGLEARLALIEGRIAVIEALIPTVPPGLTITDTTVGGITIPDRVEIFHAGRWIAGEPKATMRSGALPPAIHDATVTNWDQVGLPGLPSGFIGQVYKNDGSGLYDLPGAAGRRRAQALPGKHFASDGVSWYLVTQAGTTTSFFPTDLERELFMLHVNGQQLRAGGTFSAEFDVALQIANGNTRVQFLFVVETGVVASQTTPATTGTNLQDITWSTATPVLSQRIIVGPLKIKHRLGCSFVRSVDGATITASRLLYGLLQGGAPAPASADFALRARLLQFDTENPVSGAPAARGIIGISLTGSKAGITNV